jgi:hypothetical protein
MSIEKKANQRRDEHTVGPGKHRIHKPQEPVIPCNTANQRGLRCGGVECPYNRPPHTDHLFDECPLT